jgi:mannose-1-phosphate guanylyltransferase/mannose-6-phosphate isomerase
MILPVILAGETEPGLWPVSRDSLPKQFAQLVEGPTLFQQTLKRICDPHLFAPPIVVTTRRCISFARDQLAQAGCTGARIVCEPSGKGDAAAIALALELLGEATRQAVMVLPSGHAINDTFAFRRAAAAASRLAARNACMVALGIPPEHPETRCSYLRTGAPILGEPGILLDAIVEHPSPELAARLVRTPGVFWNSGVFLFDRDVARAEFGTHAPELASLAAAAVSGGNWEDGVFRPDNSVFGNIEPLSFEHAILAKSARAAVTPGDPGWSDLASWKAVWQNAPQDSNRNVLAGRAYCVNTTNSMALSDGPVVGVAGLDDVVVVASRDAVLVASRSEPENVDRLMDEMRAEGVGALFTHVRETCQWGAVENLDRGDRHQVRRVTLNAGESLPARYHHHRGEHWVVVAGLATITLDDHVMMLGAGQQLHIPLGAVHRLENLSHETVELIEIRYGHYIGEDDVVIAGKAAEIAPGRRSVRMARVA